MKKLLISLLVFIGISAYAQKIERVEPPCWWIDMETPLQLMIYGENLKGSTVVTAKKIKGITVGKIYNADSPNYIFFDLNIGPKSLPGRYDFIVTTSTGEKLKFSYTINNRKEQSANRKSFGSQDMVYLIMPDRFANGDSTNDIQTEAIEKADRKNNGGRHGGDIQGIINNLDYLSSLGVTAIWSTPLLFDNEKTYSYHGYACADYYKIDPRFGTNELYKEYVAKAHSKGIKIIMDMVPNHCGTAHWWMKDLPFKDWIFTFDKYTVSNFAISTQADPYASDYDRTLCTMGWFDSTMPDMNVGQPFLNQYFTQWAIWWIEYADLDGLRVDTYPYTEKNAIAKWTKNILNEYPYLNIVAECWYSDALSISYWEGAKKQKDGFCSNLPSVMDFQLRAAIIEGFRDDKTVPSWGEGVTKIYNSLALDYAYEKPENLLIFADNHDTNRLAHDLNKDYSKLKMVMTLLATMRGVPQIYVGDELGFTSSDGTTGHSQERIDFPGGWISDTLNLFKSSDRNIEQADLFNHTSKLFNWRKTSKVIHKGELIHFRPTMGNVYVYFRYLGNDAVMTIINNGQDNYVVEWNRFSEITAKFASKGKNILTGELVRVGDNVVIPAQSSAVIEF